MTDTKKYPLKCSTFPLLQIKHLVEQKEAEEFIIFLQRQSPNDQLGAYLKVTGGFYKWR